MSYLGWINVILIVIGVGISVTPTYKAYRYNLWQKFGYWNVLVLPILMLVANIVLLLLKKYNWNHNFYTIRCCGIN